MIHHEKAHSCVSAKLLWDGCMQIVARCAVAEGAQDFQEKACSGNAQQFVPP